MSVEDPDYCFGRRNIRGWATITRRISSPQPTRFWGSIVKCLSGASVAKNVGAFDTELSPLQLRACFNAFWKLTVRVNKTENIRNPAEVYLIEWESRYPTVPPPPWVCQWKPMSLLQPRPIDLLIERVSID